MTTTGGLCPGDVSLVVMGNAVERFGTTQKKLVAGNSRRGAKAVVQFIESQGAGYFTVRHDQCLAVKVRDVDAVSDSHGRSINIAKRPQSIGSRFIFAVLGVNP